MNGTEKPLLELRARMDRLSEDSCADYIHQHEFGEIHALLRRIEDGIEAVRDAERFLSKVPEGSFDGRRIRY